jgi:hypothetical protein
MAALADAELNEIEREFLTRYVDALRDVYGDDQERDQDVDERPVGERTPLIVKHEVGEVRPAADRGGRREGERAGERAQRGGAPQTTGARGDSP